jgi:hypothetical protein
MELPIRYEDAESIISIQENELLRRLVAGFPPRWPGFDSKSGHVRFVVDKVALGKIFLEYFGFPCQFSFFQPLHIR